MNFKNNIFFFFLCFVLFFLFLSSPNKIIEYPSFVHWKTIALITSLLIVVNGFKQCGYFYQLSGKLIKYSKNQRQLSIILILLTSALSTILTNDVVLFIVIPLTMSIKQLNQKTINKLIIYEAISANVGSTVSPIGNPQNIFIWHKWNISFLSFAFNLLSPTVIGIIILLFFSFLTFPSNKLEKIDKIKNKKNYPLFFLSLFSLIAIIVSTEINYLYITAFLTVVLYTIFYPKTIKNTDWFLVLSFILIFIIFHLLYLNPSISNFTKSFKANSENIFNLSFLYSQLISNVPATVFLSKFFTNYKPLIIGTNLGGNLLFFSSFANLIAIKLAKNKKIWFDFHKISIPFCIIYYLTVKSVLIN